MKARAAQPDLLVDLADLEELRGVRFKAGELEIGLMTTYADLMASPDVNPRTAGARARRVGDRRRPGAEPRHDRRQRLPDGELVVSDTA